jgi:transcriptional regulator of acetoin/glycerol metabolism
MEWKRFLSRSPVEGTARPVIIHSWTRCAKAGVPAEPEPISPRRISSDELTRRLQHNCELIQMTRRFLRLLSALLEPTRHVAYLFDRDGIVLESFGNSQDLSQGFGLSTGYDWSEHTMGTSGAGTNLVTGRPVAVIATEHFVRHFHSCTCTAAPISDKHGAVIGAIGVSTVAEDVTPERLNIVAQFASAIAEKLLPDLRDQALVRRLQDRCEHLQPELIQSS